MASVVELTPLSLWEVLFLFLALPFAALGLAILTTIYIYYVSAVPSLIWRCFARIGRKSRPPSNL